MADALAHHLEALERDLLTPATRHDRSRLDSLLAPEFREFGSSGRIFTRDSITAELLVEQTQPPALLDFACQRLSPTIALVTYRTIHAGSPSRAAIRSSLWTERDGRWQVVFHQGTRVPEPTA